MSQLGKGNSQMSQMNEENPYAIGTNIEKSTTLDGALKVTTSQIFVAWLCFFLIATLGGFVFGAILGGILGAILGAGGADIRTITVVVQVIGFAISIPVSFLCYWWSVNQFIVKKMERPKGSD